MLPGKVRVHDTKLSASSALFQYYGFIGRRRTIKWCELACFSLRQAWIHVREFGCASFSKVEISGLVSDRCSRFECSILELARLQHAERCYPGAGVTREHDGLERQDRSCPPSSACNFLRYKPLAMRLILMPSRSRLLVHVIAEMQCTDQ